MVHTQLGRNTGRETRRAVGSWSHLLLSHRGQMHEQTQVLVEMEKAARTIVDSAASTLFFCINLVNL